MSWTDEAARDIERATDKALASVVAKTYEHMESLLEMILDEPTGELSDSARLDLMRSQIKICHAAAADGRRDYERQAGR